MRRTTAVVLALMALGAAACTDGNRGADVVLDTLPPSTTVPVATTTGEAATTTSTVGQSTSTSTSAPTTTDVPPTAVEAAGPTFSDALGVKVDSAPGVNTPGDTRLLLPEGLYVHIAWEADPDDPSVFTVQPDDVEILEAYANAAATYYRAAMTDRTTDHPDFDRFFADGGDGLDAAFARYRANGEVMTLGGGVVLRPYVLAGQTTADRAVVLDCFLEDEAYLRAGDVPAGTGELERRGQVVTMVRRGDRWIADRAGNEERACVS